MFLIFLLFAILIETEINCEPILKGTAVGTLRKVGDKTILDGQQKYPYVSYIEIIEYKAKSPTHTLKRTSRCVGVIVGSKAILTVAHCLTDTVGKPEITVQVGVVDLGASAGHSRKVIGYTIHEDYTDEIEIKPGKSIYSHNDIAILWLPDILDFSKLHIKIATLNRHGTKPIGDQGKIIGWGIDESGEPSSMLKEATMTIISNHDCNKYERRVFVTDRMFCVIDESKEATSCVGDSGGPFVRNGVVYGLSSLNIILNHSTSLPCDPTGPSVYTDISKYADWIEKTLRERSLLHTENVNMPSSSKQSF